MPRYCFRAIFVALTIGLSVLGLTTLATEAQVPSIVGTYVGTATTTESNCIPADDHPESEVSAFIFRVSSQSGTSFSGSWSMHTSAGSAPDQVTDDDDLSTSFSGTVTATGQITGNVTVASFSDGTAAGSVTFTFTGQVSGSSLTAQFTGPGIDTSRSRSCTVSGSVSASLAAPTLVSSILPSSRSVMWGGTPGAAPASAFVAILNAGTGAATNVRIVPRTPVATHLHFQTTDSHTNAPTGVEDAPINIPAGGMQTFVITLEPQDVFSGTVMEFDFVGDDSAVGTTITGVNTLLLSASLSPVPDVVALAATLSNDGIVNIPGTTGSGAFAIATVNVGVGSAITAVVDTGGATLPLALAICQTSATGACLAPPAPSVTVQVNANATPTFAVFATAAGAVSLDTAAKRIFVRFNDGGGVTRGSTSVAVRTQ